MSRSRPIPTHRELSIDDIRPDTPLRLDVAAALAYPDGSMTASGLRREHKRGRLIIERTAGKDYTTLAEIERMRGLCREGYTRRVSGSERPSMTGMENLPTAQSGSSRTADTAKALAAAKMIVQGLREPLSVTLPENTSMRRKVASVHRLPFLSPTSSPSTEGI
jgi:hypothetical protein